MEIADWLVVTPASGSGNASVSVKSGAEHTGRSVRQTVLLFKAANVPDVSRTVNQAGKPEYVDIADTATSPKEGKTVTITGISNSAKLTFSLGVGGLEVTLPETYLANSVATANGAAIAGDPGASSAYNFSIAVVVPANESINELSRQIIVTDEAGNQDVCTLTQTAGDAYLTVTAGDINLDYLGTPVTVEVQSNTSWTIEGGTSAGGGSEETTDPMA